MVANDTRYKVHGRLLVMGGKGYLLKPGYLPGPVTTFWRRNAAWSVVAPNLLRTDYKSSHFAWRSVWKDKTYSAAGGGKRYRDTHFPVCLTRKLSSVSDWGGYPLTYITADAGILCACCATEQATRRDRDHWPRIVGVQPYYEGPAVECDNCGTSIESAYGDPDGSEGEG